MKKRILTLGVVLALVAILAVPMAAFADTGTTTTTGDVPTTITITAPTGGTGVSLTIGSDVNLITTTGSVAANTAFTVTVTDNLTGSKTAGSAGKMVQHDGSIYIVSSPKILTNPVQVGSSMVTYGTAAASLDGSEKAIVTACPAGTSVDLLTTVTQQATIGDLRVNPNVYRIIIRFTAQAST